MNFLILLLFTLSATVGLAQDFPVGWEGNYKGDLIIGHASRSGDTLSVDFNLKEIETDSAWTYTMIYHSAKYGEIVKDYVIRIDPSASGAYILDELDGIEIEMTYMNGCFYDFFEVLDTYYISTLRKEGNDLYFDLFIAANKPTLTTTSEPDEEGSTFEVKSYKPSQHQSVHLRRQ